jgi:hypothetical protein
MHDLSSFSFGNEALLHKNVSKGFAITKFSNYKESVLIMVELIDFDKKGIIYFFESVDLLLKKLPLLCADSVFIDDKGSFA